MLDSVQIRSATVADAPILARHRADMFTEMGQLEPVHYDRLVAHATDYFITGIPAGEYVGWVATPAGQDRVIAGAGVQIRPILPRPDKTGQRLLLGNQGLVLNVWTDRDWRRQGIARRLMEAVIAWAHERGVTNLVLHASNDGRALYEQLGFSATNEMAHPGPFGR